MEGDTTAKYAVVVAVALPIDAVSTRARERERGSSVVCQLIPGRARNELNGRLSDQLNHSSIDGHQNGSVHRIYI